MNADLDINRVTELVIGCAYRVGKTLGIGFLEKVYENALLVELRNVGLPAHQQRPMKVLYRGEVVGDYGADILVAESLIVEIKAVQRLDKVHLAQCLNYLKALDLRVGLVINFGAASVEVKRVVNGL
ncbi:MAG: GxxExxY protein [Betaproteobacteria bacterium]|nr:GxxExxY protein [Betaproteobacteria bacterium]